MDDDRRRRLPKGLLGLIALVAIIEATIARFAPNLMDRTTLDWAVTGEAARLRAPGREVLCFGDSLVKFGVLPSAIAEYAGRTAYNLAPAGGQAPSSYFLLRRALEAGARPEVIVVDFSPLLLQQGPRRVLRQWPALIDARELLDLAASSRSEPLIRPLALATALPSIRGRDAIRDALRDLGQPGGAGLDYRRVWAENAGAQPAPRRVASFSDAELGHFEDYPRRAWSCHPLNEAYLRRFLALARDWRIPVIWLIPPVSPEAQARRVLLGVEDRHERFVRRIRGEFPALIVADGRLAGFGREDFVDPVHLNRDAASDLSASLGPAVAAAAGGASLGGWFELRRGNGPNRDHGRTIARADRDGR